MTTGNVLSIIDPNKDKNPSVLSNVIKKDGKIYTLDQTAVTVKVGDKQVVFVPDATAYIDPKTKAVYTVTGGIPLPSAPVISASAMASAQPLV